MPLSAQQCRVSFLTRPTTQTAIGNVTGSQAWTGSGEQDKAAGVAEMKAAAEHRDPSDGYGKAEELAGKLTGCGGMKDEGAASKKSS